ncbi:MAG TPA: type II secretion system F family protein [Polyangiales bacterium]|nr:type II secretion system F family protein [Polyangiales bacterium]
MNVELVVLRACCLLLSAASCSSFVYVMILQPLLPEPLHGLRGLKRARARSDSDAFRNLELPMRWLGARVAPLLSEASSAALARRITIAGELWGLSPAELRALAVLGCVAGGALGLGFAFALDTPLYAPAGAVLGALLPGVRLSSAAEARLRGIARRVPHAVDLLVLSLGAGLDFPAALRQVVERAPQPEAPIIEELGLVLEELKLGRTRRQAFERFASRAPCDEVRDLVSAAIQSEEQGTPLGAVLQTQAATSRQRRSTRAEEAASKAENAMLLPTLLLFVSLMILIIGPLLLETTTSDTSLLG